jgi:hypothetical protein
MPMQPSTHVTHMPEAGTTDISVLFFVSVAALAFTLLKFTPAYPAASACDRP